ncbi:MerR family transcriptional regulator [Fructilactobacillus vespulae]|uniref:MerR family transcriptional regulator n=1 Tax=Fructilactobacillus vespulae TaxID=1249630 RepID=UPI0039B5612D
MIKNYSIGEVAKNANLTISTIRYYDKEKLIPNLKKNEAGNRIFTQENLDAIKMIKCLKRSGMPIKEIKIFMKWCENGDSTLSNRLDMFKELKTSVTKQMDELKETLNTIEFKCNYYSQAVEDGTEKYVKEMH